MVTHGLEASMTALVQGTAAREILGVTYEEGGATTCAQATSGVIVCRSGFDPIAGGGNLGERLVFGRIFARNCLGVA